MSIRYYGFAPELDGSANGKLKATSIEALYAALDKACGRLRFQRTKFSAVAETALALQQFVVHVMEQIDKYSDGVIMRVHEKLGHYRNDRAPEIVPGNVRQAGYLIVGSGCADGAPSAMTQKIVIPFAGDDVSRNDLKALAISPVQGAGFGNIRWADAEKTSLEAWILPIAVGAGVGDYEKFKSFDLVPNDQGEGVDASDPVLDVAA